MTLKHKNNLIINNWDKECDNALIKIKTIIMKNPIIIPANSDKQFIIYTDASETAIGAGIFQKNEQNQLLYPIEYGSHILNENQVKKWSIAEKEAYALTLFLNKWKYYFYHRNDTIVYTDNITVKLLLESKKISRKLQRWKMSILQFNIIIKHI